MMATCLLVTVLVIIFPIVSWHLTGFPIEDPAAAVGIELP